MLLGPQSVHLATGRAVKDRNWSEANGVLQPPCLQFLLHVAGRQLRLPASFTVLQG